MRDLFDSLPEPSPDRAFDGATYKPERDHARLSGQLGRVFGFMRDGAWHGLDTIAAAVGGTEAAVSARLRDLRKEKYGAFKVERRHIKNGLHLYRVIVE